MNIDIEIEINRIAQSLVPLDDAKKWFLGHSETGQIEILQILLRFLVQAHPIENEIAEAIVHSDLKPTFTPCVILINSNKYSSNNSTAINMALEKLLSLKGKDTLRSFLLMICLLSISDKRRRDEESDCDHWWHQDLSNENVIAEIRKKYSN